MEVDVTLPPGDNKEEGTAFSQEKHNITSSEELNNVTLPPSELAADDGVGFLKENRSYTIQPEEVQTNSVTEMHPKWINSSEVDKFIQSG